MTVNTLISLALLIYVMNHKPITLDFGGWKAPFGIQFLGDTLSLLMVTVASFVVTLIMAYGFGPAEERVNRYYLPTFIFSAEIQLRRNIMRESPGDRKPTACAITVVAAAVHM